MSPEFGPRLRKERERRKISLDSIAATTKVSIGLFEGLERDDVSRWPNGIFRRSFVRAYAIAVGLDPDVTVREFLERFPDPDTLPVEPALIEARRESPADLISKARVKLTVADTAWTFTGGRVLSALRGRWTAVSVDAAVIVVTGAFLFLFIGAFWMPLALFTFCYYWGSILIVGNTPGVCLAAQAWYSRVESSHPKDPSHVTPIDRGFNPSSL
jgi:transcriptional regulator with XRE-family HTH domain